MVQALIGIAIAMFAVAAFLAARRYLRPGAKLHWGIVSGAMCLAVVQSGLIFAAFTQTETAVPAVLGNAISIVTLSLAMTALAGISIADKINARRHDRQTNLRADNRMMTDLLDALPISVSISDRDGNYVFVNKFEADRWGNDPDALIGKSLDDVLPAEIADKARAEDAEIVRTGRRIPFFEERVKSHRGNQIMLMSKFLVNQPDSGVECIGMVCLDVTERVSMQDSLQILNAELEETRRRADAANLAKSEFLASMSHEIRTPLNGVLGMATLLMGGDLDETQRRHVETIRSSGNVLLSLLNDILDISKIEAGHMELEEIDFDLYRLLDSAGALLTPKAESQGLAYTLDTSSVTIPVLRSDPTRIRQVLFNLLSNALKFTEEGGISVSVSQSVKSDHEISTRFEIRDTGIGIQTDRIETLFEKFTQADSSISRKYGGSGLGLAVCKELVQAMDGEIGATGTENGGATFWFSITSRPETKMPCWTRRVLYRVRYIPGMSTCGRSGFWRRKTTR